MLGFWGEDVKVLAFLKESIKIGLAGVLSFEIPLGFATGPHQSPLANS